MVNVYFIRLRLCEWNSKRISLDMKMVVFIVGVQLTYEPDSAVVEVAITLEMCARGGQNRFLHSCVWEMGSLWI